MDYKKLSRITDSAKVKDSSDIDAQITEFVSKLAAQVDSPDTGSGYCSFEAYGHEFYISMQAKKMPTEDQMGTWITNVSLDNGATSETISESDIPSIVTEDWADYVEDCGLEIDESAGFVSKDFKVESSQPKESKKSKPRSRHNYDYAEAASNANIFGRSIGDKFLYKALNDRSMEALPDEGPYRIISNGKYLFMYADARTYWKNDYRSVQDKLKSEGWEWAGESDAEQQYAWELFEK